MIGRFRDPDLPAAGDPRRGWLTRRANIPVALGRGGIRANKREGDGGTQRARSGPCDCGGAPTATRGRGLFAGPRRSRPEDAWCEDPADRRYNRPVRLARSAAGDRLRRDDHLYDFIIEIDHNTRPRIAGRGSAVFFHLAREKFGPTAGCVAMTKAAMLRLLQRIGAANQDRDR